MTSQQETLDVEDVRLAIAGDREAFGRLYDRYARAVRAVVVAVSRDFGAVEDLTQETFLRGYSRLASLQDESAFRPWIQGVARMVGRERRREISRDLHRFESDADRLAPVVETPDALAADEEQRRLESAVADLPERERLAVHAYFFLFSRTTRCASCGGDWYVAERLLRCVGASNGTASQSTR